MILSTKPVATAPPSAASRELQRLRLGVGEAQRGVAEGCGGLLRVHPGRSAVWLEPWLERKPGGCVRSPLRARLEEGHVVGRLCWEGGPGHPKGPAERLGTSHLSLRGQGAWVAVCEIRALN